jgi:hypothetical protein
MTALPVNSLPLYWLRLALGERARGVKRTVVATIGDGSFQYSVQAIWTAAQHRLPVVFVVMRNYWRKTPGVPGLDLPGLDIASIAAGFGCRAVNVDSTAEEVLAHPRHFVAIDLHGEHLDLQDRVEGVECFEGSGLEAMLLLRADWIEHPDFTRTDDPLRLDPLILLARIPQLGMLGRSALTALSDSEPCSSTVPSSTRDTFD